MSFFKSVFANASTNAELVTENERLVKDVKRLEGRVEGLSEELKTERRVHREEMYLKDRDIERDRNSFEYERSRDNERHADEVAALTQRAEDAEKNAEETIKTKVAEGIAAAKLEIHDEYIDEIDELKEEVNDSAVIASACEAESKQKDTVIKSLEARLKDYREFVQFTMGKLPNVDLSKFNINVDVPPTKVELVSQGQKKN